MALADGGPAEIAGLRAGDGLLSIDGAAVPPSGQASAASPAEVEAWRDLLFRMLADGTAEIAVARAGRTQHAHLVGAPGCPADFRLELSDAFIAGADGQRIRVSTAVMAFVADDDELAAVLAHELAHNILRHRARLDAAGVDRTLARELGIRAGRFRAAELEADRLSVALMATAGYDPQAAVRYMERAVRRPGYREGPTYPRAAERIAALRAAVAALRSTGTSAVRPPARSR